MKRMLLITGITLTLGYLTLCLGVFLMQRQILYQPASAAWADQLLYAQGAGLEPWLDANGGRIGWKRVPVGAAQRWLVLPGNAGLAVQRGYWADSLEGMSPEVGRAVYILEYPGYGRREGEPTEKSLVAAALAAMEAIPREGGPVYLLGESLGCAVAAQVTRSLPERVGGLVLVTPFNRLADVAAHHYPWLPVRWLVRDQWRSDEALRAYPGPVAIIAAERDSVVPAKYAQRLHDRHPGRKWLHVVPGEDHNFFVFDQLWFREAVEFVSPGVTGAGRETAAGR